MGSMKHEVGCWTALVVCVGGAAMVLLTYFLRTMRHIVRGNAQAKKRAVECLEPGLLVVGVGLERAQARRRRTCDMN